MPKRLDGAGIIDRYLKPICFAAHRAKTHTNYEMQKIPSWRRCRKWRQINTAAIKEYHAWIGEELENLNNGGGVNARGE